MRHIFILLGISVLLLTGCAATGPAFAPAQISDPDAATVYIYRKSNFALRARAAYFYVNDVNVFDLNAEGYSWVALPGGKYTLRQGWAVDMLAKSLVLNLEVRPRETRYFSFETGVCAAGYREVCVEWVLREQRPEVGRREIQEMKFQENFGASKLAQQLRSRVSQ
jgi:hypothetical protein